MTIHIELSEASIENAIRRLEEYRDTLNERLGQVIEILTNEGAEVAEACYGEYPVHVSPMYADNAGTIAVTGDMPLIAEFGAGDATLDPGAMFEHTPTTDVFPGSYSLEEGSGEYWRTGKWHFGGRTYYEVPPRMGLYTAKLFIIDHSTEIARGVFGT